MSVRSRSNWNLEVLDWRGGENRSTRRKSSRSKRENQQQTETRYGTRNRCLAGYHITLKTQFIFLFEQANKRTLQAENPSVDKNFEIFNDKWYKTAQKVLQTTCKMVKLLFWTMKVYLMTRNFRKGFIFADHRFLGLRLVLRTNFCGDIGLVKDGVASDSSS